MKGELCCLAPLICIFFSGLAVLVCLSSAMLMHQSMRPMLCMMAMILGTFVLKCCPNPLLKLIPFVADWFSNDILSCSLLQAGGWHKFFAMAFLFLFRLQLSPAVSGRKICVAVMFLRTPSFSWAGNVAKSSFGASFYVIEHFLVLKRPHNSSSRLVVLPVLQIFLDLELLQHSLLGNKFVDHQLFHSRLERCSILSWYVVSPNSSRNQGGRSVCY